MPIVEKVVHSFRKGTVILERRIVGRFNLSLKVDANAILELPVSSGHPFPRPVYCQRNDGHLQSFESIAGVKRVSCPYCRERVYPVSRRPCPCVSVDLSYDCVSQAVLKGCQCTFLLCKSAFDSRPGSANRLLARWA
jgi:hypothetical protein